MTPSTAIETVTANEDIEATATATRSDEGLETAAGLGHLTHLSDTVTETETTAVTETLTDIEGAGDHATTGTRIAQDGTVTTNQATIARANEAR